MKVKITQEMDLPKTLICHEGRHDCYALTEVDGVSNDFRRCAYFGSYVKWSDEAGFFVRCKSCIEAHMKYLREGK